MEERGGEGKACQYCMWVVCGCEEPLSGVNTFPLSGIDMVGHRQLGRQTDRQTDRDKETGRENKQHDMCRNRQGQSVSCC